MYSLSKITQLSIVTTSVGLLLLGAPGGSSMADTPQGATAASQSSPMQLPTPLIPGAQSDPGHDRKTATPLQRLAKTGDPEGVKAQLEAGVDVSQRDGAGQTALHWAVLRGHEQVAALLLAWGADVNAADAQGVTPLLIAAGRRSMCGTKMATRRSSGQRFVVSRMSFACFCNMPPTPTAVARMELPR